MNVFRLSYTGNKEESYDLLINGQFVAKVNTGEDQVRNIIDDIEDFMSDYWTEFDSINIQNDSDEPINGIIVDLYQKGKSEDMEHHIAGRSYWFEDYTDNFKYAVDVPPGVLEKFGDTPWINVDYFNSYEEALEFVQDKYGADENGKVCLISKI